MCADTNISSHFELIKWTPRTILRILVYCLGIEQTHTLIIMPTHCVLKNLPSLQTQSQNHISPKYKTYHLLTLKLVKIRTSFFLLIKTKLDILKKPIVDRKLTSIGNNIGKGTSLEQVQVSKEHNFYFQVNYY